MFGFHEIVAVYTDLASASAAKRVSTPKYLASDTSIEGRRFAEK